MIRLHFVVEGSTEELFVNNILQQHLAQFSVYADARRVKTGTKRVYNPATQTRHTEKCKGGVDRYLKIRDDIRRWLNEDRSENVRVTTMIDLYQYPNDSPGYDDGEIVADSYLRVNILESALAQDISDARFIPYLQVHEFDALLFSSPDDFCIQYLDAAPVNIACLQNVLAAYNNNPELINKNYNTIPSRQIKACLGSYPKTSAGPAIAAAIGLERIRQRCRHFNEWLTRLENLS